MSSMMSPTPARTGHLFHDRFPLGSTGLTAHSLEQPEGRPRPPICLQVVEVPAEMGCSGDDPMATVARVMPSSGASTSPVRGLGGAMEDLKQEVTALSIPSAPRPSSAWCLSVPIL